jgi:flagellar hook assembly protein FlgD
MLRINRLNQFIRKADIQYEITESSTVNLGIYDMTGQLVRNLANGNYDPGFYRVIWDGKDEMSKKVHAGLYFVQLETENYKVLKVMRFK